MSATLNLSPAEWADINHLYHFYSQASDLGDAEGFADCFTQDGTLEQVSRGLVLRGRQAIADFKRQEFSSRAGKYRRHWNSGIVLTRQDDGSIRGQCYLHNYSGMPGWLPVLEGAGVYDDSIRTTPQGWRFAHRSLVMDARNPQGIPATGDAA